MVFFVAPCTKLRVPMSYIDLQITLHEWPYDPEQISVRKILGSDGTVRIQMRVELGVLQMEGYGRPDGHKPYGCDSLLEYHRKRITKHQQRDGTSRGYLLTPEQCRNLRDEASLYYRRYVAQFVLEEFEDVIADTSHTLGIFDVCRDYAHVAEDRTCLESFRPYVMMMKARAYAYKSIQEGELVSALAHVNRGIMDVKAYYEENGDLDAAAHSEELRMLYALAVEVRTEMPEDSLIATRQALRDAIEHEQFERAARLRDVLRHRFGENSTRPSE